ncbi:MAG: GntR family transcriptional regulator, partial [Lachnospiraceae bacterium]|nr:GntR family transcriptional regulator [Lachnospiraceae bacterium]
MKYYLYIRWGGDYLIELDYRSKKPLYEQIIEQIKLLVIKGHLSPGDSIPSVRKMAQTLDIT